MSDNIVAVSEDEITRQLLEARIALAQIYDVVDDHIVKANWQPEPFRKVKELAEPYATR